MPHMPGVTAFRQTDGLEPAHYVFHDVAYEAGQITGVLEATADAFGADLTYLEPNVTAERPARYEQMPPPGHYAADNTGRFWGHVTFQEVAFLKAEADESGSVRQPFSLDVSGASDAPRFLLTVSGPGAAYTDEGLLVQVP